MVVVQLWGLSRHHAAPGTTGSRGRVPTGALIGGHARGAAEVVATGRWVSPSSSTTTRAATPGARPLMAQDGPGRGVGAGVQVQVKARGAPAGLGSPSHR